MIELTEIEKLVLDKLNVSKECVQNGSKTIAYRTIL